MMLRKDAAFVQASNRNGLAIAAPKAFEEAMASLPCFSCHLDNEWLGSQIAVFDILELDGVDLRKTPAKERKRILDELLAKSSHPAFLHVETAFTEAEKRALHGRVYAAGDEGVVAKKVDSPYTVGRPNSGGDQVKRKFVESCTCLVTSQHPTKRSVGVSLREGAAPEGAMRERGSVTIPTNHAIPEVGDIVEVHYLYAYRDGSLYQSVYKGKRTDQGIEACHSEQLKFKKEAAPAVGKAVAARR